MMLKEVSLVELEPYERHLDRLQRLEREGKGKVITLFEFPINGRLIPHVGISSGDVVLVTVGHSPYATIGTYDTGYRLFENGVEGITLVNVSTPLEHGKGKRAIDNIFSHAQEFYSSKEDQEHHIEQSIRDEFGLGSFGESPNSPNRMVTDWGKYKYGSPDASESVRAVENLVAGHKIIFDLCLTPDVQGRYFLLVRQSEDPREGEVSSLILESIVSSGMQLPDNIGFGYNIKPGLFGISNYTRGDVLGYAARLGKLNYAPHMPVFSGRNMADAERNVSTTAAFISKVARVLR